MEGGRIIARRYIKHGLCGKTGVYLITCLVNGKRYVGSSVEMCGRINQHFGKNCERKYADINPFYGDIRKYGRDAFSVEVLEFCTREEKLQCEQKWYRLLSPEYNMVEPDECPFNHQEVQDKAKKAFLSEQGQMNHLSSHRTPEYRLKMKQQKRCKCHPCTAYAPDGTAYHFNSRTEAAKWLKREAALPSVVSHIRYAIEKHKIAFGYRWEGGDER